MIKNANWEKIGFYIACLTLLFMFWQSWRDINLTQSDMKERIARLEVQIEQLEMKK